MSVISSPHLRVAPSVSQVMRGVLLALVPGAAASVLFFGWSVLLNLLVTMTAALAFEALALRLRGRPLQPFLKDSSAVLTGALLALCLPPDAPLWLGIVGAGFAVLLGKQVYGGIGYNPFNPAMVGFVVLLISFPVQMTAWGTAQPVWAADALSSATPLDHLRTQLKLARTLEEIAGDAAPAALRSAWLWISLAYLVGGLWMLQRRLIRWQIPVSMLLGLTLTAGLFWLVDAERNASPLFHLLTGATMIGAFFIATDPVSAATTPRGRLVFGFGIGVLIYVIRSWGAYPDAVAFAVLLMNLCAPTIDRYTPTRVYGQGESRP